MQPITPPPRRNQLPVIQKLVAAYKLWHALVQNFRRTSRYTLGAKIDSLLLEVIENTVAASYLPIHEKSSVLAKSISKLDFVKFFLEVAWEIKELDSKKYIAVSEKLDEAGRMLGGWKKGLEKKTLAQ
ncbi:MAG: four helix bundle protein [Candidatus Brennerbacteria bacterium]|nr:four helix bundle protein [Candidatus Brennerbacteria bacterium]